MISLSISSWFWSFFNLVDYQKWQIIILAFCFVFWVLTYYFIIKDAKKFQFCEMPMLVATGNIAWEFSWTFLFDNNLSIIFTIGCFIWFSRDLFINAYAWKFWKKDVTNPWIAKTYHWWYIFSLAVWFAIVYFMHVESLDNDLGVVSALIINVVMSSLYIYQLLSFPEFRNKGMSSIAAWFKMLGTGTISFVSFFIWPENEFLLTLCIVTFILDMVYIGLYYFYEPHQEWLEMKIKNQIK
jgi:hypothetical protein